MIPKPDSDQRDVEQLDELRDEIDRQQRTLAEWRISADKLFELAVAALDVADRARQVSADRPDHRELAGIASRMEGIAARAERDEAAILTSVDDLRDRVAEYASKVANLRRAAVLTAEMADKVERGDVPAEADSPEAMELWERLALLERES